MIDFQSDSRYRLGGWSDPPDVLATVGRADGDVVFDASRVSFEPLPDNIGSNTPARAQGRIPRTPLDGGRE